MLSEQESREGGKGALRQLMTPQSCRKGTRVQCWETAAQSTSAGCPVTARGELGKDRGKVGACREQGKDLAMGYENQAQTPLCRAKWKHFGPKVRDARLACGACKDQS